MSGDHRLNKLFYFFEQKKINTNLGQNELKNIKILITLLSLVEKMIRNSQGDITRPPLNHKGFSQEPVVEMKHSTLLN